MYKKLSLIIFILLISFAFAETKSPEKVIINSIGMEFVLILCDIAPDHFPDNVVSLFVFW